MSLPNVYTQLLGSLFSDEEIETIFSDAEFVRQMLAVEAALATAEGNTGVIPQEAARHIAASAPTMPADMEQLRRGMERATVPVIALVRQLRDHVGEAAADYVHWGATSQDIVDTARALQIREAVAAIEVRLWQVIHALQPLADGHRQTLMAGRTHSQQALPIPFGLKVAGWLAPLLRHMARLAELKPRLLVLQFGGAAGTLAALGDRGIAVQEQLAEELALAVPPMPWHTQRDGLGELAGWLSMVTGSLAKIAQDIILMAQSEIGEVWESDDPDRGGSSTMPQKRNPIVSERIIAAARANAALLPAMHQAMIQEHERGTHGWQMEWLVLPQMLSLTASTLRAAGFLGKNLVINSARMRQNVEAGHGLMMAEAISFALAEYMPHAEAKELVRRACQTALEEKRHLLDVLREHVDVPLDWAGLRDESSYFGVAERFIDRVLTQAEQV